MVRVVWAKQEDKKQLYLVDKECEFILPAKRYLDHLAALERSPHTLENYTPNPAHWDKGSWKSRSSPCILEWNGGKKSTQAQ